MNLLWALLYSCFLGFAHFGWGRWCLAKIVPHEEKSFSTSQSLLMGLFAAIGFAFTAHFVFSLGNEFLFLFWFLGFFLSISYFWNQKRQGTLRWGPSPFIFLFLLTAFLAAAPTIELYDTGLYHLPFVRWMQSERMVWGLSNLESRFGFNSSLHVWAALVGNRFLPSNTPFIANAFLFSIFFLWLFEELKKLRGAEDLHDERAFVLGLVVFLSPLLINGIFLFFYNTGLPVDLPSGAFSLLACYSCFALARGSEVRKNALLVLLTACLAITAKLSQIAAVLYIGFALFILYRRQERELLRLLTILGGIFGGLWIIQTWMMTGCLLFPVPATCMKTSFSFSSIEMGPLREEILAWAQNGTTSYHADWFPHWWSSLKKEHHLLEMIGLSLIALTIWIYRLLRHQFEFRWADLYLLGCALGFLAVWFIGAPDLRFGYILFVIFALTSFSIGLRGLFPNKVALVFLILFFMAMGSKLRLLPGSWQQPQLFVFVNPPVESIRAGEVPIFHPTTVQACWDNPSPCTMFPRPLQFDPEGWFKTFRRMDASKVEVHK